jgi:hypothetical protein
MMVLDPAIVEETRRLRAAGLSYTQIVRRLPISRGSVAAIIRGERPDYEALRARRQVDQGGPFGGLARRCGICGVKVQLPCLACAIRAKLAAGWVTPQYASADGPLRIELRGAEARRYRKLHQQKQRAHGPTKEPTEDERQSWFIAEEPDGP